MRLYEEYLNRHSITDVLVAKHCDSGSLILRTTDASIWTSRWLLLSIHWENHDHHPGQYKIDMSYPIHNGYVYEIFFDQYPTITKKWHEYEEHLINWATHIKGAVPVVDSIDITLAAWEMFVFSYDSWFSKQAPNDIKKSLFESINKNKPISYRHESYQDVLFYISKEHPSVMRFWKCEFLNRLYNYSYWLAELIKN